LEPAVPLQPLPRDVKRALDLVEADPARLGSVCEWAAACGVAARTLQKHFRRFLDRTPLEVQRELRFEGARRELLRARAGASVTGIAMRWGFAHLGRFAVQYQQRYKESPSATLRRRSDRLGAFAAPVSLATERPAIAVLPFELVGAEARCASGIADAAAASLCRLGWRAAKAAANAQYEVRGSVREDGQRRLLVTIALLDAQGARHLWADAWHTNRDEACAFVEQVGSRIAHAMQPPLRGAEGERAWRKDRARLNSWELTMRALPCALSLAPASESLALEFLEQAMERAPRDPLPIALASWCHGLRAGHHFTRHPEGERRTALALAARGARLDSDDPLAETLLAAGYTLAHDLRAATLHADRALSLDGAAAWAWGRSGWILLYDGKPEQAIERFQIARGLAPADRLAFLSAIGIGSAHLHSGRYDHAITWYERAIAERPTAVWNDRFRAAAYALAGRKDEARRTLTGFVRKYPGVTISLVRAGLPYGGEFLDRVAEGLESAGMRP
jgi:AraC-like DNA-binding protein/tetratricopeptide (TPR) repeat protein